MTAVPARERKKRAQGKYQVTRQQTVVTYNHNCWLTPQWNLPPSSTTTLNSHLILTEVLKACLVFKSENVKDSRF